MSAVAPTARAARLRAQLLVRPVRDVEQVVERLLAVQAQDSRAFRLAVRPRSSGRTADDVDAALTDRRSLAVSWLCRGTLHLVRREDYPWLHALTAPRVEPVNMRYLRNLGVDGAATDRAVAIVVAALADGPRSRDELRSALESAGVTTAGEILTRLLVAASLREHVVRGPVRDGAQLFVDARRWWGRLDVPDRDVCLVRLARRYLAGHEPAAPPDLAAYAGLTVTDARRAFALLVDETRPFEGGLTALQGDDDEHALPPPRLLGMFDPVLHGWAERGFVTAGLPGIVTANGIFRATALVQGRVCGTWTLGAGAVTLAASRRLPAGVLAALEADAFDVLRFLALPAAPLVVRGGG